MPHLKQGCHSRIQSKIGARFGIERLQGMRDAAENKHRHFTGLRESRVWVGMTGLGRNPIEDRASVTAARSYGPLSSSLEERG